MEFAEFNTPDRPERSLESDPATTPTLSRAHWDEIRIDVPVDGVYGYHRYARQHLWGRATVRQRRGPVTALSALELDGNNGWTRAGEVAAAGPLAVWDAILMGPRMIFEPPWERVRHLPTSYWRTPIGVATAVPERP